MRGVPLGVNVWAGRTWYTNVRLRAVAHFEASIHASFSRVQKKQLPFRFTGVSIPPLAFAAAQSPVPVNFTLPTDGISHTISHLLWSYEKEEFLFQLSLHITTHYSREITISEIAISESATTYRQHT